MTTAAEPIAAPAEPVERGHQTAAHSESPPRAEAVPAPPPTPNREERRAAERAAKKSSKRPTFEQMKAKKPREQEVTITLTDEDGNPEEFSVRIRAIGSKAYDKLIAAHPPTSKQREQFAATFNIDTFGPALISACLIEPRLSVEDVMELYESDDWAPGEIGNLYFNCNQLCSVGLNVPFNAAG